MNTWYMSQVSLNYGSGCNGRNPSIEIRVVEPLPPRRNSKPVRIQTNRIRPARYRGHKPSPGIRGRRASWLTTNRFSTRVGTFVPTAVGTGMMPPHFVTPTEPDRKTTTLRQHISRVASVQPSISPTSSPPKGATKLQRYYPLEIGIRLSEPGRATAFRDTPPSRANRRSFVYILGPATAGQTRAFCPEYMGTCMGYRVCQTR